jgi:hypothetical protein
MHCTIISPLITIKVSLGVFLLILKLAWVSSLITIKINQHGRLSGFGGGFGGLKFTRLSTYVRYQRLYFILWGTQFQYAEIKMYNPFNIAIYSNN